MDVLLDVQIQKVINRPDNISKKWNLSSIIYNKTIYRFLHMTDDMLGPSPMHTSIRHMYTTYFAYDRPIFLVPLSPSYPSSPVSKKWNLSSIICNKTIYINIEFVRWHLYHKDASKALSHSLIYLFAHLLNISLTRSFNHLPTSPLK